MGKLTPWEERMNIDRSVYFMPAGQRLTEDELTSICEESYSDYEDYDDYDDEDEE